jgi:hypothetical protein
LGREGQALVASQARLATNVAARLIERSGAVNQPSDTQPTQPSETQPKPNPGPGPSSTDNGSSIGCNARGVVALWLAARTSPQAADGLRQEVTAAQDRQQFPFVTFTHDVDPGDPLWGVREGQFALALLERPDDQVAQTLWRNWDLVTSPETTLERLGELLGVQPPPDSPDAPDSSDIGGPLC